MKQSFGAELFRIAGKMKESAAWPSPSTGLAFHILQLLDDGHRHWPDSIKITFPEGQLDTAPLIASAGYSMCIAAPNPEQSARWQSALARIVKRDPFPRDRQTFAFRPSELVGIAMGLSKSNLVGSASGSWVRWVIETLPTKNPTPDIWALLLYHYAAALVGIIWPTHLSSRLADYELPDLSLLLGLLTSGGIQRPPDIENRKLTFAIVQRAVALSEDFREPEKLAALLAGISFALRNEMENSVALESKKTSQSAKNMSEQPNPLQYQRQSPAEGVKRPLVVVVHGIRTSGKWFQRIKPILECEADCVAEPAGFGFLNVFRFLLPGPTRRHAIEIVKRKLIHAIELHKGRPLIIIAHSFGTYCITNILKDSPQIRPSRLLFCGSIVDQEFRWDSLSQMAPELKMAVINECGARDIWPPLAHSMTWGYGGSGSGGFQFPGVVDRHHDLGHSGFFTKEFVQDFWVPFVRDGTVAASKYEEGILETPLWIHLLGMRPVLPWLLWIVLIGFAGGTFLGARVWTTKRVTVVQPATAPASMGESQLEIPFVNTAQSVDPKEEKWHASVKVDSASRVTIKARGAWVYGQEVIGPSGMVGVDSQMALPFPDKKAYALLMQSNAKGASYIEAFATDDSEVVLAGPVSLSFTINIPKNQRLKASGQLTVSIEKAL